MDKHALIVEDDSALLDLFSNALSHVGWQVTAAANYQMACSAADDAYDIILCDIELPDGNMMDVIAHWCETNAPVVVITANEGYYARCQQMGVNVFLRKPVPIRDLIHLVNDMA